MWRYLLRRAISSVPTVFGVALIVFLLFHFFGGDPVYLMVGKHANPQILAELRHEYGLDRPLWQQFLSFLWQIVTFDFGRSYATKQPISDMIVAGIGPTLTLAVPAFFMTTFVALGVSVAAAYYHRRMFDRVVVFLCVLGMSMSMLSYILFGQYVFAFLLGWFPISGFERGWPERVEYVMLPALIWLFVSLGYDARFFRAAILEETSQDYVRTARAKGLREEWVYFRHVLKNSMVPVVTQVVLEIPLLILGSFLLESFFGIPGVGGLTIDAVHNSDLPVIQAMTILNSLLIIFGNILTDWAYTWVDPRMRLS